MRKADDAVIIRIADSGKGMPRESLDKVFEPFFTTKDKGTGLGLAIVFNIIRKHDGDIPVESERARGRCSDRFAGEQDNLGNSA